MERRDFLEFSAALTMGPFIPKPPPFLEDEQVITRGDESNPQVALTFDDGFLPRHVERILQVADEYSLKFTFFPVGWRVMDTYPALWRSVVEAGHEIGNHSHSHRILRSDKIKPHEIMDDIWQH